MSKLQIGKKRRVNNVQKKTAGRPAVWEDSGRWIQVRTELSTAEAEENQK
jgi:hypothetical protein